MEFAEDFSYGILSNSELVYCNVKESGIARKVLFRNPNKGA